MLDKNSNLYTFVFAIAVCAVSSFTLAAVSQSLKPVQDFNASMDVKKNILKAARLTTPVALTAANKEIDEIFKQAIEETSADGAGKYPLFIYKENGKTLAYIFPVSGSGLWSTIYGYMALEADAITIRGISFYKHGETPGLGAEVEKNWFQDNFRGKKIWDTAASCLRPVSVVKGKVSNSFQGAEADFYVDGISGSTLTGNGVTEFLKKNLGEYEFFFSRIRAAKS